MRKAKKSSIEVKVGMYNEHPKTVSLPAGSSVQDVLDEADISLGSAESIWVDGDKAEPTDTVEDGDNLQIVGKKEGGAPTEDETK
jgi:hypothetical protein